uniref:Glyoxalase 1 n=1 Tax=Pundamilia nyererei TaxID=303518 RepID=A0A3B4F573_9CICH
ITDKHSALVSPTCSLQDYMLQQTMLRVKDPSDPKLLPCCSAFTFYSLGYEDKADTPADVKERTVWTFSRRATLELTQYVWKQPSDADLSYHNGNNEPFVKKPETGEFFSQVWPLFRIEILSPNNTFSLMSS